jgi:murein DD-endopeptidase MepM/ murein hydrolase activator NlpD
LGGGVSAQSSIINNQSSTIVYIYHMKTIIPLCLLLATATAGAQTQSDYSIRGLKGGQYAKDTSYVYWLPYPHRAKYLLIQAYDSKLSHRGELALDFKMKVGSKVCAAREGVVVAMRKDSDRGGLKDEMLSEGNYIIIRHGDGTQANYWHFKKDGVLINVGDTVQKGQPIGLSGNTGYSAFPHLHFEVVPGNSGYGYRNFSQLPTRFYTKKGIMYLRPGKYYKALHRQP